MTKNNRGNRAIFVKIHEIMKPVIKQGDDGLYEYAEGWNDARIAKETGAGLVTVQGMRREMFGNLRKPTVETIETVMDHLRDTQTQLATMSKKFDALLDLHEKLCTSLSVNKVIDVRHLAGTALANHGVNGSNRLI